MLVQAYRRLEFEQALAYRASDITCQGDMDAASSLTARGREFYAVFHHCSMYTVHSHNLPAVACVLWTIKLSRMPSVLMKSPIAVQTLWYLHFASNICHLDLSPENIMVQWDKSNPWDTVRLIDFGFARKFNPGKQ